jgi:signal transduction histidine kinase
VVVAGLLTAAGLALVGWFDYRSTRAELLRLLRDQAATLRQTVAAAARSNEAAGAQAESQVAARLLDNARLLAEIDRTGGLSQALLDQVASQNHLFRVTVFAADGSRQHSTGVRGFAPPGRGFGGALLDQLLSGEQGEAVSGLHAARGWGGGARVAAGVRRAKGGAIVLNADASDVAALWQQASLESLLHDIAASAGELAYVSLAGPGIAITQGMAPPSVAAVQDASRGSSPPPLMERETTVEGRPILEVPGTVTLKSGAATLRLGLRLDGVRQAERRLLVRVAVSLLVALVVSLLMLWSIWLRRAYAVLSDRHARAEAALRRRDRLSAMGELAATVAHEVRNPLNAIAMSSKRLKREFLELLPDAPAQDRNDLGELLGVVEHETQRINAIVQQFLEYARPPKLAPRPAVLGDLVRAVVEASRALAASRGVTLETDGGDTRQATIDADQLRQAIDNLVRNAIEATRPGGRVTVTATAGAKESTIAVRDTGSGMDPETVGRIFDLYFTTKPDGTGIGLAVTQQIVSAHGGTIEVESAPGAGTCMTIRLPAMEMTQRVESRN